MQALDADKCIVKAQMQVAFLAEPKTPLESSVFYYEHYQWLLCTHHEALLCDCTIHY